MKAARLTPLRLADCKQGRTLDLGCGKSPQNPFELQEVYGIDIQADTKNQKYCAKVDLAIEGLPFPNEHFDAITAYDFIEHVPRVIYNPRRRNSFVELMNEIHRCLKPNGIFMSVTSAFPNTQAFQDPTHVNIITEETFPKYFCTPYLWSAHYGFTGIFTLAQQKWVEDGKLLSLIVKPIANGDY